jgi:Spy/CpxP family protein refolding chaperone
MHMTRSFRVLLFLALIALLAGPALAQRPQRGQGPGQGGLAGLLTNEGVQKELKLDTDQAAKVKDAVGKVREKYRDEFAKLRDLGQEERRAKAQELQRAVTDETLAAVGDVLKPEQLKRLKEIELQQAGAQAFNRQGVRKALALTDEQKDKIKGIVEDAAKAMRDLGQGGQRPRQPGQDRRPAQGDAGEGPGRPDRRPEEDLEGPDRRTLPDDAPPAQRPVAAT